MSALVTEEKLIGDKLHNYLTTFEKKQVHLHSNLLLNKAQEFSNSSNHAWNQANQKKFIDSWKKIYYPNTAPFNAGPTIVEIKEHTFVLGYSKYELIRTVGRYMCTQYAGPTVPRSWEKWIGQRFELGQNSDFRKIRSIIVYARARGFDPEKYVTLPVPVNEQSLESSATKDKTKKTPAREVRINEQSLESSTTKGNKTKKTIAREVRIKADLQKTVEVAPGAIASRTRSQTAKGKEKQGPTAASACPAESPSPPKLYTPTTITRELDSNNDKTPPQLVVQDDSERGSTSKVRNARPVKKPRERKRKDATREPRSGACNYDLTKHFCQFSSPSPMTQRISNIPPPPSSVLVINDIVDDDIQIIKVVRSPSLISGKSLARPNHRNKRKRKHKSPFERLSGKHYSEKRFRAYNEWKEAESAKAEKEAQENRNRQIEPIASPAVSTSSLVEITIPGLSSEISDLTEVAIRDLDISWVGDIVETNSEVISTNWSGFTDVVLDDVGSEVNPSPTLSQILDLSDLRDDPDIIINEEDSYPTESELENGYFDPMMIPVEQQPEEQTEVQSLHSDDISMTDFCSFIKSFITK